MIRCATLSHRVDRHANARNRRGRQALAPSAADFPTAEIRAHQSAPARTASRHQAAHLRFDGRWGRAGPWCIRVEAQATRGTDQTPANLLGRKLEGPDSGTRIRPTAQARPRRPSREPASRSGRPSGGASARGSRRPSAGPRRACRGMKMAFEGSGRSGPKVWFIRDRGLHWENADG